MAGLEYTLAGPTLRADDYTLVALTGGAVEPKVNGKRVNMFEPLLLAPGDTLEIGMLVSGLGYALLLRTPLGASGRPDGRRDTAVRPTDGSRA